MKRTIAAAVVGLSVATLAGCTAWEAWTTPTADGGPSQAETTTRTASDAAAMFGPGGLIVSTGLGAVAGVLELLRRKGKTDQEKLSEGLRIVAGAVDDLKLESPDEAQKVVKTVKTRASQSVQRTIDKARSEP